MQSSDGLPQEIVLTHDLFNELAYVLERAKDREGHCVIVADVDPPFASGHRIMRTFALVVYEAES